MRLYYPPIIRDVPWCHDVNERQLMSRISGVAHEVEKLSKIKSDSPVNMPPVRSSPSVIASAREGSSVMRTRSGLKTRASLASSASEDHPARMIFLASVVILVVCLISLHGICSQL